MTLQRLQNKAKMTKKNAKHKDEWSDSWLSVENLFRFDRSVMTYKILNKISPNSLWEKFYLRSAYLTYETRSCKNLQIPKIKTELMRKIFQYSAVKDWNNIPVDIRKTSCLNNFKKQLKAHLKS